MALYRGSNKLAGIGKGFNPENTGTTGQVLTKTDTGYAYCDNQGGGDNGPKIDLLVVAGGGGGGGGYGGGGGGGGVKECKKLTVSGNAVSITIGAGGTCQVSGCDSIFGDSVNCIKALGGGAGGNNSTTGKNGGNGGGAGGCLRTIGGIGLEGGNAGGYGGKGSGGGGGGACGKGDFGTSYCSSEIIGGFGGPGFISDIFCSNNSCLFGSGGGGGSYCSYGGAYPGGGIGGYRDSSSGKNATYYGGGGGGGNSSTGGCGYQGVVMLRYPTDGSYGIASSTGGNCCFTCDGYCYVEFTSDGTFTPTLA